MLRWLQRLSPLPARRSGPMLPGLLLAVWALASQIAAASLVLPGDLAAGQRAVARLDALSVLCTPSHVPGQPHAPAPHPRAELALCPLQAVAASGAILSDTPTVPLPRSGGPGFAAAGKRARAPPAPPYTTALPRGPPADA